jgi:hypothetical protein
MQVLRLAAPLRREDAITSPLIQGFYRAMSPRIRKAIPEK